MFENGSDIIGESLDAFLKYDGGGGANHDIYDKRMTANPPAEGFSRVPHCVYFYYVRIDNDGRVRVDHYFYVDGDPNDTASWKPIPYEEMPAVVYRLALNGRPSTRIKNPASLDTRNFQPIPWDRVSYVAIFFDEANWTFHRRADGISSVVFNPHKGLPNDTFFDGKDLELHMPNQDAPGGTDKRSAVFFVNHMKGDWGDGSEGREDRKYKFDMWLMATFAEESEGRISVNFDPGGTNQGPALHP